MTPDHETGWWDHHGRPAPWPDGFFNHDNGWQIASIDTVNSAPGEEPF